jgi:Tfp pilus assembly protein PilX
MSGGRSAIRKIAPRLVRREMPALPMRLRYVPLMGILIVLVVLAVIALLLSRSVRDSPRRSRRREEPAEP